LAAPAWSRSIASPIASAPGASACLLGPSGCGKSTLIQIIAGLERATSGMVRIEDPQRHDIQHPLGATR
jgi:ABC-type sugar transport system ATPase subunit